MDIREESIATRREFLRTGLTLVGVSATVPAFLSRTASAFGEPGAAAAGERILVVVQLAGGNDGLNTVIPIRSDDYYKSRPRIGIPGERVLRIRDDLGLHPAATGLKDLHDAGRLAVVQGVGYPNPNRSHFASTDIWETASPDGAMREGWIGRYFDHTCSGTNTAPADRAIALKQESPLAFHGDRFQGVSFTDARALRWNGDSDPRMAGAFAKLNGPAGTGTAGTPGANALSYLTRVAMDARVGASRIQKALGAKTQGNYPRSAFGYALTAVAKMIAADLPTRVYYVSLGGFDTHSNQAGRHDRLMRELGQGVQAFVSDLEHQGNLDRTLVMTFSEFGRRVEENASGGTDHGTAAPLFLFGSGVRAGVHGRHPNLERLQKGDLVHTTDFRRVYAAVLGDWLGADADAILGKRMKRMKLIQAKG